MHARTFADLGLPKSLIDNLARQGITEPFPIQAATMPDVLAGRDVLGRGQTGSGKTLAFGLPLLATLAASRSRRVPGRPRALVLAPTRELACQISDTLSPLAQSVGLKVRPIFGGAGMRPQIENLRRGVDIVVATPGRLMDLIEQRECSLELVSITVIDEADHMCDLGFLPPVMKLLAMTPADGQRLLFSATLDNGVQTLVDRFLSDPVTHSVAPAVSPVDAMDHHFLNVEREQKLDVAAEILRGAERSIVFVRTKHGADRLARQLSALGVKSGAIHGNLAQNARTRALAAFSSGATPVLVATDVAARGIHVDSIDLVLHFDPPTEHKAYLHRSGRTARAGARGVVATLLTSDQGRDAAKLRREAGIEVTPRRVVSGDPALMGLSTGSRPGEDVDESELRGSAPSRSTGQRRRGGGAPRGPRPERTGAPRGDRPQAARSAAPTNRVSSPRVEKAANPQGDRPSFSRTDRSGQPAGRGHGRPQGRPVRSSGGHGR